MASTIEMQLAAKYWDAIKAGKKTAEVRVFDPKRQTIRLRDTIVFTNVETGEKLSREVSELRFYPDFRSAISDYGLRKLLPDSPSLEEGIERYNAFGSGEKNFKTAAKKYGVLLIGFRK